MNEKDKDSLSSDIQAVLTIRDKDSAHREDDGFYHKVFMNITRKAYFMGRQDELDLMKDNISSITKREK